MVIPFKLFRPPETAVLLLNHRTHSPLPVVAVFLLISTHPYIMAAVQKPDAPQGLALYSRFAFAGACCCSITHGAVTPLDV